MAANATQGKKPRRGRPPKLSPENVQILLEIVRERASLSLDDIAYAVRKRTGVSITGASVRKYLKAEGFTRQKVSRARTAAVGGGDATQGDTAKEYGYREAHRDPGDEQRYPCGLTDREWEHVKPYFDPEVQPGRPPKHPRRKMLDAILYVLRSGCPWSMLPKDFPPYNTVYRTFRRWQTAGRFEILYDQLRALWRQREHRAPDPTAALVDSQSIRTSPQGGVHGFDAGKKVKGRKRHIATDTLGLILAVIVTAASVQDRDMGAELVGLAKAKCPTIERVYVDGGYAGDCQDAIRTQHDVEAEVVRHPANQNVGHWCEGQLSLFPEFTRGFVVLPKRWAIERTNGWNLRARRLIMDHDRRPDVTEAWIWLAEGRRLLRRLCEPVQPAEVDGAAIAA